jgi:hypothetical protein
MGKTETPTGFLEEKLKGKRQLGRPHLRWDDNIKVP